MPAVAMLWPRQLPVPKMVLRLFGRIDFFERAMATVVLLENTIEAAVVFLFRV
jgi:hypothetical protein